MIIKDKNVLVLEDNVLIRRQLEKLLSTFFINPIDTIDTADHALNQFEKKHYDLIVCDINMPGHLDGLEFIEKAKEINPDIKSIVISAFCDEKYLSKAKVELKVNAYLIKPFKLTDIINKIAELNYVDNLKDEINSLKNK